LTWEVSQGIYSDTYIQGTAGERGNRSAEISRKKLDTRNEKRSQGKNSDKSQSMDNNKENQEEKEDVEDQFNRFSDSEG
jgi:hypothetical protein